MIKVDYVAFPVRALQLVGLLPQSTPTANRKQSSALHEEVTRVFVLHRESIFRYTCGILHDAGEAEDTVQEAFLRYYRERRKGQTIAPRAWLFRVAHNLAIDRLRHRSTVTTIDDREWTNLSETAEDARLDVHGDMLKAEQRRKLDAIVGQLTSREQQCIDLRLEGLRYREIAEILGIRVSSVENYLARAVKKVVRQLDA